MTDLVAPQSAMPSPTSTYMISSTVAVMVFSSKHTSSAMKSSSLGTCTPLRVLLNRGPCCCVDTLAVLFAKVKGATAGEALADGEED